MDFMFKKLVFVIVVSAIAVPSIAQQRLLRGLKEKVQERVEEKVEQRVNEKVDEKIDEQLDKIEESLDKNKEDAEPAENKSQTSEAKSQARMLRMMKGMGIGGEPVPIAENYTFDHLIQMHIESFDQSGKKTSEGEFLTHLNPKSKSMAYEALSGSIGTPGSGRFIMDAENGAAIILSEENGKKTGIVYGINSFMQTMGETYDETALEESPELYAANPNVKKTGKTKTIAGYKCEEYIYTDEDTESEIWITKDLKMNTQDFFSTLFKTSLYSHGIGWGYLMETSSVNKTTGEKSMMKVTRVDTNSNVKFAISDYQITNLGNINIPME